MCWAYKTFPGQEIFPPKSQIFKLLFCRVIKISAGRIKKYSSQSRVDPFITSGQKFKFGLGRVMAHGAGK